MRDSRKFTIVIIFTGLLLVTAHRHQLFITKRDQWKGFVFAFGAMILWSICGSFIKIPILEMGWFWPTYLLTLPASLLILAMRPRDIFRKPPKLKAIITPLAVAATVVAETSYNVGIGAGAVSVVAPIAGSYATLSAVLAVFLFREPMNTLQKIGVALTLVGIVWLSFASV